MKSQATEEKKKTKLAQQETHVSTSNLKFIHQQCTGSQLGSQ